MTPAVRKGSWGAEEGGSAEEKAGETDSVCKVMGLLGMGHRLFVPRLLAVRLGQGLRQDRWAVGNLTLRGLLQALAFSSVQLCFKMLL